MKIAEDANTLADRLYIRICMARIKITLPTHVDFSTEIALRIGDINYGGHLGNDAVLALVHEARVQLFASLGFAELDIAGLGIILTDAAVVYKAEAFYGDRLRVALAVDEFSRYGCDIYYCLSNTETGKEVARAKTGLVFFDYAARKLHAVPAVFRAKFTSSDKEREQ